MRFRLNGYDKDNLQANQADPSPCWLGGDASLSDAAKRQERTSDHLPQATYQQSHRVAPNTWSPADRKPEVLPLGTEV